MERKNNQLTFLDNITSDLGGKRTAKSLPSATIIFHGTNWKSLLKTCTPITHQKAVQATGQSS